MDAGFIPKIRLDIEHMKGSIVHAMGLVGSEMEESINKEVDKAMRNLDLKYTVQDVISEVVREKLKSYFMIGDGAIAIRKAIKESVTIKKSKPKKEKRK